MSTNTPAPHKDAATDTDEEEPYTYHIEPEAQGGARYVRCETCGAEAVPADPETLSHREGCSEASE